MSVNGDDTARALPSIEQLTARLGVDDPVFEAWRDSVPDKHWTRLDLSALRIGYELGKALAAQPRAEDPIVRFNDDGTLDEVVGIGQFHLEQMGATHWWMQLGPHMVNLHSKAKIKVNFGKNEAQGGGS